MRLPSDQFHLSGADVKIASRAIRLYDLSEVLNSGGESGLVTGAVFKTGMGLAM